MTKRKGAVIIFLLLVFMAILGLFWHEEWVYSLPTPVPSSYTPIDSGTVIDLDGAFAYNNGRPLLLHFFNPDCPCSRFNITHFKSLVARYGREVNFGIVVLNNKAYTAARIQELFDTRIPISFDSTIAAACGVYSTPQAVIIDAGHRLYYRGNYNRSRYCSDAISSYAQIALEGLLHKAARAAFDRLALTAYGCRLPQSCKK